MLFKKKKKDTNIEEAIEFVKLQKKANIENMDMFVRNGFSAERLKDWDRIYDNILKILKSIDDKNT